MPTNLGSLGRIGWSAQRSTTGFQGEGHIGAQSPAKLNSPYEYKYFIFMHAMMLKVN